MSTELEQVEPTIEPEDGMTFWLLDLGGYLAGAKGRQVTRADYHKGQRTFAHKGVEVGDHSFRTGYLCGRVDHV